MATTITIEHPVDDTFIHDLWYAVWTMVEEGVCDYWIDPDYRINRNPLDEDEVAFITISVPPEDGVQLRRSRIGAHEILWAFKDILEGRVKCGYPKRYLHDALVESDIGHIDGDAADVLLQVAAIGEITYG